MHRQPGLLWSFLRVGQLGDCTWDKFGRFLRFGAMQCRQRVALDASTVDLRAGLAVGAFALRWGLCLSCPKHCKLACWLAAALANALVLHCNEETCTRTVQLSSSSGSLSFAYVAAICELQCLTLNRRTRVTPGTRDITQEEEATHQCHSSYPACHVSAASPLSDSRARSRQSDSLVPQLASRLVLYARRRSTTPANCPSLSFCPRQSPRRISSRNVPSSSSSSAI